MRGYDDADRSIDARKLRYGSDVFHVAHASAAIFGRKDHAQQAQLAQFLDRGQWEFAGFIPLHDVRCDLALRKLAHTLLEVQLLFV